MAKILKLIVLVVLATLFGIWASSYHGYVMLVVAQKSIKINLVALVFIIAIIVFALLFSYRFIKFIVNTPISISKWLIGIFLASKEDTFTSIVADVVLHDNQLISRLPLNNLLKITPMHYREYFAYNKLQPMISSASITEIENILKQVDHKTDVYKYFLAYKYLRLEKYVAAENEINKILDNKKSRFIPKAVDLGITVAIKGINIDYAKVLLKKYSTEMSANLRDKALIFIANNTTDPAELKLIYVRNVTSDAITALYAEKLLKLGDSVTAQKILKKSMSGDVINARILYIYVNAFGYDIAKLVPKVCKNTNTNLGSVLMLLDLAMYKSDLKSFNAIYHYIEENIKQKFTENEMEKYSHILCKFYIKHGKNGVADDMDLSEARLVYDRNN